MQNADSSLRGGDPKIFNVTHDELYFVRMNWTRASSKVVGGCADAHGKCDICCGNPIAAKPYGTGSYVSAVCWFAARDLADLLGGDVPVGAIDQSYGGSCTHTTYLSAGMSYLLIIYYGWHNLKRKQSHHTTPPGTSIQFWMGADAIARSHAPVATQCCGQNGCASCLFNTQIFPYTLGPMQFSAALFYQGEQNANCGGPTQVRVARRHARIPHHVFRITS